MSDKELAERFEVIGLRFEMVMLKLDQILLDQRRLRDKKNIEDEYNEKLKALDAEEMQL